MMAEDDQAVAKLLLGRNDALLQVVFLRSLEFFEFDGRCLHGSQNEKLSNLTTLSRDAHPMRAVQAHWSMKKPASPLGASPPIRS